MIAVLFQYELPLGFLHGLFPTALTMDATHDGPPVLLTSQLWSELIPLGTTQETPRSLQFVEMSDKMADGVSSTFEVHSLPVHCLADRAADVLDRVRRHPDAGGLRIRPDVAADTIVAP